MGRFRTNIRLLMGTLLLLPLSLYAETDLSSVDEAAHQSCDDSELADAAQSSSQSSDNPDHTNDTNSTDSTNDTDVVELENALSTFTTVEATLKSEVPTIWAQGEPAAKEPSRPVIEPAVDEGSPPNAAAGSVVEIPPDQPEVIDETLGTPFVGTEPSADVFITILRPAGQPAESGGSTSSSDGDADEELKKKEFKITLVKEIPAKDPSSERTKSRHSRSRKPASASK